VLPASAFGAPHPRERVFLVAYPRYAEPQGREQIAELGHEAGGEGWLQQASDELASHGLSDREWGPSDSDCERLQGNFAQAVFRQSGLQSGSSNRSCEDWRERSVLFEPKLFRTVNGIPNYMDRIKCLGNAIVPQVAQYVGECIMAHHGGEFTFAELFAGIGGFRLGFEWARVTA
jgi:DNA (cytosine-5)-methyltransferase 1